MRPRERAGICLKCSHTWRSLSFPGGCFHCGAKSDWLIGAPDSLGQIEQTLITLGRDPRVINRNRGARESAATAFAERRPQSSHLPWDGSRAPVFRW